MGPITIVHDPLVTERFPAHATAAVRVHADAPLRPRAGAVEELRARVAGAGGLDAARLASEHWRSVYARMGAKPKYRCSVALLLEHYEQRDSVPAPVALVELYCWFSLAHGVPMAGYRSDAVAGPLRLTVPGRGLPFTALGHPGAQPERTKSGEVGYVDDEKAICRYWNCRDCDQTKLVDGVADALFVFDLVDAPGLVGRAGAEPLLAEWSQLLDGEPAACGGLVDGELAV